ncbi:DNA/RNA helicase domain-containing protein [Bacillus sp. OV166]|uniref:DNA/RNA helicase domain-containing protein n=1 Tax=Bacillus sp. OV166 TaxID=1882763 RepID=UPI0011550A74
MYMLHAAPGGFPSGLSLWNQSIKKGHWIVHTSDILDGLFPYSQQHIIKPTYNLTHTLRSHAAIEWHKWVEDLFQCHFSDLKESTSFVIQNGLNLYVTRSVEKARTMVQSVYQDTTKQYGNLVSSKGFRRGTLPILEDKSHYVCLFQSSRFSLFFVKIESLCYRIPNTEA